MYPPDDLATCAFIKILWDFHCGLHGIPQVFTKTSKPEWERNAVQEKIRKMSKDIEKEVSEKDARKAARGNL